MVLLVLPERVGPRLFGIPPDELVLARQILEWIDKGKDMNEPCKGDYSDKEHRVKDMDLCYEREIGHIRDGRLKGNYRPDPRHGSRGVPAGTPLKQDSVADTANDLNYEDNEEQDIPRCGDSPHPAVGEPPVKEHKKAEKGQKREGQPDNLKGVEPARRTVPRQQCPRYEDNNNMHDEDDQNTIMPRE